MSRFENRYFRALAQDTPRSNDGSAKKVMIGIAAVFAPILLYVFLHMQSIKINNDLKQMRKMRDTLKSENRVMELKLKSMVSTTGIEQAARQKYGFKDPEPGQVFIVKR